MRSRYPSIMLTCLIGLQLLVSVGQAQTLHKIAQELRATERAILGQKNPHADRDLCVEELAKEIDWLEHLIESYGTVVPKQPDVWGEARLTRARFEYEREVAKRFNSDDFNETLQASVRQSDQAALSLAFALNAASGGASMPTSNAAVNLLTTNPDETGTNPAVTPLPPLGQVDYSHFSAGKLSLEPTEVSRQLDVYLKNLNDLRRVNEGGDTADSPGYALNLLRIPVSVLPGHNTRKGFGAEITFTMKPVISDDLLPTTMRNLIINDLADLNALPLAQLFNNDPEAAKQLMEAYWRFKGKVATWIDAYDMSVQAFAAIADASKNPAEWQADIEYLYLLRPYLQFRFLQIATQAEQERVRALSCLKCLDPDGRPSQSTNCNPTGNPWLELKDADLAFCPLLRVDDPACERTLSITAQQFSDFLDDLANNIRLGGLNLAKLWANGGISATLHVYTKAYGGADGSFADCDSKHCNEQCFKVTIGQLERSGNLVDRHVFPFHLDPIPCPTPDGCSVNPDGSNKTPDNPPKAASSDTLDRIGKGVAKIFDPNRDGGRQNPLMRKLTNYDNLVSMHLDAGLPAAIDNIFDTGPVTMSAPIHSGTGQRPLVGSQIMPVYGFDVFCQIAYDAYTSLRTNVANHKVVHVYDINQYLAQESLAAYNFLERNADLWSFADPDLAHAIDSRDLRRVFEIRQAFYKAIGGGTKPSITAALAWAIIVDAARLNYQLIQDMTSLSQAKGCNCAPAPDSMVTFVGPKERLTPDAHEYFKQYVLCRWPIIVFSLDPVNEEQNVADVFSRRRDLQLAVAVAVASGNVSPSAAGRFTRRMELDMETIALNRTAVAFSHGNDTFGWRFYPRVQSPDTPGTLGAFTQTLLGTANRDNDMKTRQLEPGIRDCTAVVIMPSFVPYVDVTTRANWFGVTNPRKKELTLHDTMRISRTYQTLQGAMCQSCNSPLYRPADLAGMTDTLEKLEKRMPLQNIRVEIPYQNTLGGFDLFATGVDGLGPQLEGWYGAPGIDPDGVTTLYLIGKKFSVHETRVIVGGRTVPFRMLSRNVLEISVPPGTQPLLAQEYQDFVDVQVAAPYGVSSHMLVPRVVSTSSIPHFSWATASASLDVSFKAGPPPAPQLVSVSALPELQMTSPIATPPITLPVNLTITEYSAGKEIVLGTSNATARYDAQRQRYVIDGQNFNGLATDLIKIATTRFGVIAPVADQNTRWLVRGTIAPAASLNEPVQGVMVLDVTFRQLH